MASESATSIHARTCHLCEANCGVLVEVQGRKTVSIRGNPDHVLSRGHICPKATALADLQDDPDRLRRPIKRTADGWQEIDWETAFAEIGARMAGIIASGGQPALYMGNPNAHNYATGTQTGVLRKALGVRTLYSASTLDQIPHQLVQMWMYGHNALFPIPDVDRTHFMLIIGGNPLARNGSVWTVPDVKKRLKAVQALLGLRPAAARDVLVYWLALLLCVLVTLGIYAFIRSRHGLALAASRDNAAAARSVGVRTARIRHMLWIAVAFASGMVGAVVYLQKARISPDAAFSVTDWTAYVIFIVVIGGVRTIEGPMVGVLLLWGLVTWLAQYGSLYLVVLGTLAILIMLFMPRGVWGAAARRWQLQLFPTQRWLGRSR